MTSSDENVKLLFFDTFYHDQNKEELNIDLIQFSEPVVVCEVRLIPLKTQVEINLSKGYRLGGTFPSEFKLDVFVNNLNKPSVSTFEKLGRLDYKENANIQLKPDREIPTDGLILKGLYKTVTFAVYGWVTVVKSPQDSPPPPPPPLPLVQTNKSKIPAFDTLEDEPPKKEHPLDLFSEQLQQHTKQALYSGNSSSTQSPLGESHRGPPPLEEAFSEMLRAPSPRRSRDRGSSRDRGGSRDRGSSRDRERDRAPSQDSDRGCEFNFPPEPKEPYNAQDKDGNDGEGSKTISKQVGTFLRDGSRERDFGSARGSRDGDRPRSREKEFGGSRSSRDEERSRERDRELVSGRVPRDEDRSREGELVSGRVLRDEDRSRERELVSGRVLRDEDRPRSRERELVSGRVLRDEDRPRSREREFVSGRVLRDEDRPRSRERDLSGRVLRDENRSRERDLESGRVPRDEDRSRSRERDLASGRVPRDEDRSRSRERDLSGRVLRDGDRPRSRERELVCGRVLRDEDRSRSRERELVSGRGLRDEDRSRERELVSGRVPRDEDRSRSRERDLVSERGLTDEDRPRSRERKLVSGRVPRDEDSSRERDLVSERGLRDEDRPRSRERDLVSGRVLRDEDRPGSRERELVSGRVPRDDDRSREMDLVSERGLRDDDKPRSRERELVGARVSRDEVRSRERELIGRINRDEDRPRSRECDVANLRGSHEEDRPRSGEHEREFGSDRDEGMPKSRDRDFEPTRGDDRPRSRDQDNGSGRGSRDCDKPRSSDGDFESGRVSREEDRPGSIDRDNSDLGVGRVQEDEGSSISREKERDVASLGCWEEDSTRSREREFGGRAIRDEDWSHSREHDRELLRKRSDMSYHHAPRETDGRDDRNLPHSRESSKEPGCAKDVTILDWKSSRDEHVKNLEKESEQRENDRRETEAREKEKREQGEREIEKELQRSRQRENELLKETEQKQREREEERDRDKEVKGEQNEREKDTSTEVDVKKDRRNLDHRTKSGRDSLRRRSLDRSRSRSGSRPRKWSRSCSPQRPTAHFKEKVTVKSEKVEHPPGPPLSEEEEMEDDAGGDEEMEDQEIFDTLSERSGVRRQNRTLEDSDAQETERYEDISSDDEMEVIDVPNIMQVMDMYEEEEEDDGWDPTASNPLDFYLSPFAYFKSPALSAYELQVLEYSALDNDEIETPREARTLLDIMYKFGDQKHQDSWVEAMEQIPAFLDKGLSFLLAHEKKHNVLEVLVDWVMEGCDPDLAMTQPDAAFKIRHLKIGIKLSGLMCACDETIALLLLRRGLQSQLLSLCESQFIVFSVKHLAMRALAKTAHYPSGIQWFLGSHQDQKEQQQAEMSAYQRLIKNLLKPKIVKLTMSATALLKKVHFYETVTNLYKETESILSRVPTINEELAPRDEEEPTLLKVEDEDRLVAYLVEVTEVLTKPHEHIGQPPNAVPYSLLVDNKTKSPDTIQAVFNIAGSCCLLESVLALLSCHVTAGVPTVYLSIHTLLQQLMSTQHGLLFLASHLDATNGIIRCLLQTVEETEDSGEDIPFRQLGLEVVYHLQALQYLDQLLNWHIKDTKVTDDADVIAVLHGLHTMTFSSITRDPLLGRSITAKIISFDRNIEAFLPFLEKSGDEEFDSLIHKSVSANYTIQLLLMIIKTSADVQMLEHYASRIMAICEDSSSIKLGQLSEWLTPTKKLTGYDLDNLPSMMTQLKHFADNVKKVPPGLITVVRVIHSLISGGQEEQGTDGLNEARYRYVVVELYSADCFPIFINILQKLSESQLKVWQQGIPYTTEQWLTYFSIIGPTLSLVKATICQLIQACGSQCRADILGGGGDGSAGEQPVREKKEADNQEQEPLVMNPFKDLTSVPVLLELHTVMCSVPTSSLYNADLGKIQKNIVDTLLAFTQEELQQTQTDDALNKSLWTLMVKELLKYTIKSPYTYMSGLLILSELLPLPFPLHTKEPLTDEEMDAAIVSRKLWSVHLQAATPELSAVLDTLSGTGCQPLQHLMRRVCWQIADLAAPSSLRVTKILLDILMVNLKPKKPMQALSDGEKKEGDEELTAVRSVSIHTAKTLNLLAYLLSHPGIKAALLQLIGTSINSDAKYKDFLPIMLQLLNQTTETPAEIQAQEGIVSMIQSLCDLEVSMVNTDLEVTLAEHLANSLPESILMADITAALLEHVGNTSQSYASILPCLRILSMLTDHDYGFFHLKMNLENNITTMHHLLSRINNTFSMDSSDCLSTLSAVLELLRLMTTLDQAQDEEVLTRSKVISRDELRHFLWWNSETRHPLEELEELFKEEETLETILESITALTSILRDVETPQEGDSNREEILLPVPASLIDLFKQRAIFTLMESEDERLSPNYWLANPAVDEPDAEPEVLRCDLQAVCEHHLQDFNLELELKKEATAVEEDIVRPKRPKDRRKSQEVINIYRGKPGRKPFVAPMRGRGIMSHGMTGRGNDLFRTRTPNTSRPPSMHVDDFVKMENSQQQQTPPQQPQPPRLPMIPCIGPGARDNREKELSRIRGSFDRARGFQMPSAGRFFTPPGSYRREPILHEPHSLPQLGPHPSHRGGSRGAMMSMDRNRPNFMAPRQFPRGPDRMGPPPMDHHKGGRNGHFSPNGRGGRGGHWGRGRDMMDQGRFAFQGRREPGRHMRSFTK